jgi:hypothetical protein
MKQQDDCPVMPLARQYEALVRKNDECDGSDDEVLNRMEELVEAASHLTPRSVMGATFQIICASGEIDRTGDADTKSVREASAKQVERLHYRAVNFLLQHSDGQELAQIRERNMPPRRDPQFAHQREAD